MNSILVSLEYIFTLFKLKISVQNLSFTELCFWLSNLIGQLWEHLKQNKLGKILNPVPLSPTLSFGLPPSGQSGQSLTKGWAWNLYLGPLVSCDLARWWRHTFNTWREASIRNGATLLVACHLYLKSPHGVERDQICWTKGSRLMSWQLPGGIFIHQLQLPASRTVCPALISDEWPGAGL